MTINFITLEICVVLHNPSKFSMGYCSAHFLHILYPDHVTCGKLNIHVALQPHPSTLWKLVPPCCGNGWKERRRSTGCSPIHKLLLTPLSEAMFRQDKERLCPFLFPSRSQPTSVWEFLCFVPMVMASQHICKELFEGNSDTA